MTREFNSLDEIQKYYDEKSNTYIFREDGIYIDLFIFKFNLDVDANISASNIRGWNIKAYDIDVYEIYAQDIVVKNIDACSINAHDIEAVDIETYEDIKAWNIHAHNITAKNIIADNIYAYDISYWAVCYAIQNIECHSMKGRRKNHTYFALDGSIYIDVPIEMMSKEALEISLSKYNSKLESGNKALKALNIIKEKNVDIEYIKTCFDDEKGGFKEYNAYVGHDEDMELTQEEYDLLNEVLEDD